MSEEQSIHGHLTLLAAATAPPSVIADDIRERLTLSDLRGFAGGGGFDRWAIDALGEGWVERRVVEWMIPAIEDVLDGGDGAAGRALGSPAMLIGPDWSVPAVAAMAARDMIFGGVIGTYPRLHDVPELAHHLEAMPDELHALFRRGEPAWASKLAHAKRDAALRALLALMR